MITLFPTPANSPRNSSRAYRGTCARQPAQQHQCTVIKNFNYDGSDDVLSFDSTFAFLNRSGCILNTFSLKHANVAQEEITSLLFAMPYLETLILGPSSMDSLQCAKSYNFGVPWVTDRMLDLLADTAEISTSLDDQDEPFLPNLRSFNYTGCVTFSWECIPFIFGERRIKESGASGATITNQRPFHSLTMELYSRDSDPDLDPNVISELKRFRTEEGYEIQILDVTDDARSRSLAWRMYITMPKQGGELLFSQNTNSTIANSYYGWIDPSI